MERDRVEDDSGVDNISVDPSSSSVNNLILDYYRKFGRNRDLEQFFSLSTANSEIRDPTGTFWRKMKSQNDSSDSEKKSVSPAELCRISIKCSIPEPSSSQQGSYGEHQNSDSESPPIVTDEMAPGTQRNSDEESVKSEDIQSEGVQSQKSNDATLDTSMNKPHSPTSSVTSQRKLEWDSLADVGYGNESDRKTSASSLSTLERLALNQQYSNNDSQQNIKLGPPTSHSTPVEESETKYKGTKGLIKKTTKIYQKDVDLVELNMPHNSQTNLPQAISVNLSKHICFNVEKDGGINIGDIKKDITVAPEKNVETPKQIQEKLDKEIQTSLVRNKDQSTSSNVNPPNYSLGTQKFPVLISLNTLKKRNRKRKVRVAKKKLKNRNKSKNYKDNAKEIKPTEQLSEAESFEYMPGHIYNQNHLKINQSRGTHVGNKSSLESSAGLTTDSSKGTKQSFSKDLEKSIDLLKTVLQQHNNDSTLKKKLIKEVVQRLIKSKYRDDESSTDFLSGLSFNSLIVGERNHTTTSTSDANNTGDKVKLSRPKKSILQTANFNSNDIASTSQSAPNLASVSNSEKPVKSNFAKPFLSNTNSEASSKERNSRDMGKTTSSEDFYKKYLEALKREQLYRRHLRDKENFMKQKLVSSDTAISQVAQTDLKTQSKLKSLIKDLTRNNYNDGSGDASNLEGHSNSNVLMDPHVFLNNQRSHSVFTLSSGHSDGHNKNPRLKSLIKSAIGSSKAGCSKNEHHYCCCPYHTGHPKVGFADSSIQVNIKCDEPTQKIEADNELRNSTRCTKCKKESPRNITKVVSDSETGDLKYICVCSDDGMSHKENQNVLVYKCSRLVNKSVQLGDSLTRSPRNENKQSTKEIYTYCDQKNKKTKVTQNIPQYSKSSQTNVNLNLMVRRKSSAKSVNSQFSDSTNEIYITRSENDNSKIIIQEAFRCIQTDISINPRLSDPCLSDINIIDDDECVKLVKEQYKEVTKSCSENNTEAYLDQYKSSNDGDSVKVISNACTENKHQKNPLDCSYIQSNNEIQSDLGLVDNIQNENFSNQFTIPIQGTNMTLKVNLGTTDTDNNNFENVIKKTQGVVTEKIDMSEHFTSLREDCTKSVQCCDGNIFQQLQQESTEQNVADENTNIHQKPHPSTNVNTCLIDKPKCNTYPKKDQSCARKPLLRANTDISNFENLNSRYYDFKNSERATNKQELLNDNYKGLNDQTALANPNLSTKSDNYNPSEKRTNFSNEKNSNDPNKYQPGKCATCSSPRTLTDRETKLNSPRQHNRCIACSNEKTLMEQPTTPGRETQADKFKSDPKEKPLRDQPIKAKAQNQSVNCMACSNKKGMTDLRIKPINENNPENCTACSKQNLSREQTTKDKYQNQSEKCSSCPNKKKTDQPIFAPNQTQHEKCTNCSKQTDYTGQETKAQNLCENCTTKKNAKSHSPSRSPDQNQSKKCSSCSNQKYITDQPNKTGTKPTLPKKCTTCSNQKDLPDLTTNCTEKHPSDQYMTCSSKCSKAEEKKEDEIKSRRQSKTCIASEDDSNPNTDADPLIDLIEGITKRFTKKDIEKSKRKRCFKEIMNVLNYLLDTEESSSCNQKKNDSPQEENTEPECCPSKSFIDKSVQSCVKPKSNKCRNSESSEIAATSDLPTTSSDSATCKVLNKIKKECEKYHQKRCKSQHGIKTCETTSTTSASCNQCKRVHHCYCARYKCKTQKVKASGEKTKKKCVAYNLILQTSDSVASEEPVPCNNRPLRSIIVKVPSKRKQYDKVPFKEVAEKFECDIPNCRPRSPCRGHRSKSLPNESEMSSTDEFLRPQIYTVREYLERNRPDFVENCSRRQDCLKTINETRPEMCPSRYFKMVVVHTPKCVAGSCLDACNTCYGGVPMTCNQCVDPYLQIQNEVTRIANERYSKRKLLSLQLAKQQTLSSLTDNELRHFAKQLSEQLRRKKVAPKFISEREMKKHSEKIYKSLPEVTRKKEEAKKENIKKTNLLMANIFKKNLQKKTLRGSVNLSNYSTVIKI